MANVLLIIVILGVMVLGFFIAKRLDAFSEQNGKAMEKEKEEKPASLRFLDTKNYEKTVSEIESFKKTHRNVGILIYDAENPELSDAIEELENMF